MASPWKFLSRLVPRRREPKQDDAEVADKKPDVLALSGPAEIVAEESLSDSSAAGEADDAAKNVVAAVVAGDRAPSDLPETVLIPSPDATDLHLRVGGKPRKQMGRPRKSEPVDTPQVPPDVSIPSGDTLSLDDEIRVLRGQLAGKLRVQNAQLKKMLERFER